MKKMPAHKRLFVLISILGALAFGMLSASKITHELSPAFHHQPALSCIIDVDCPH